MARLPGAEALGERPVPTLPRRTPQVALFRPTTGMEDAGAQALAHGGAELQQAASVALQAKEHQDTLIAEDAYNRLQAKRLELEFDPKTGFRNVQGLGAMGPQFFQTNVAKFSEVADQLAEGLDPNQKEKFLHRAGVAGLQYRGALLEHQSHQTNTFNDNTEANGVAIRLRNIGLNWGNDVAFATGIAEINGLLNARGMRKNLPPEQTEVEKAKALDEAWGSRIKAALIADPLRADAMFRQHEMELGPQLRIILEHELKTAVMPVQAKTVAERIISGSVLNPDKGGEVLLQVAATPESTAAGVPAPLNKRDTRANLAGWISTAEQAADRLHPGDPVFRDLVVTQIKGYVNTIVAAQDGIARQAHGVLMTAAMGSNGRKPLVLDQLLSSPEAKQAWSLTDPQSQRGILALLEHNAKEARGEFTRSNPTLVRELHDRMFLDENDPKKLRSVTELVPHFARGLNQQSYDWLKKELETARTPEGNAFLRDKKRFTDRGAARMKEGILGRALADAQPELISDAAFNFELAVDKRIDELRKEGKVVRDVLFDPKSPEYILRPGYVESFLPTARAAIKERADKTRASGTIQPAQAVPLPEAVNSKTGERLVFRDGKWQKP